MARVQKIAVLGAGAIGTLVGALLARAGHEVTLVTREANVPKLREEGISVRSSLHGNFTVPVRVVSVLTTPVDVCVVAVKQTGLRDALDRIDPESVRDALVVPLLNGVEHMGVLRERFPDASVVAGVIRVEATLAGVGCVDHGSPFTKIEVASDLDDRERLTAFVDALSLAGVDSALSNDEDALLWGKLGVLAPFALVTTRYGVSIGEALEKHHGDLEALVSEASAVAEIHGSKDLQETALRFYASFPFDAKSSMQRDAAAGRPLELDAIGGAVSRAAERHGLSAPVTDSFVATLSTTG